MAKKTYDLLKFCTPASWWGEKWREGLYCGNGKIGADVFGGLSDELILINDSQLHWHGRPSVVPDVSLKVKDVRKRIANGDYIGAQTVLTSALNAKNFRPLTEYSLPVGQLCIKFDHKGTLSDYVRTLNMSSGEATVEYNAGATKYKRRLFVSRANNYIVYEVAKQGGQSAIDATFSFDLLSRVNSNNPDGECVLPEGVECKADKQMLYYATRNDDDGTDFGAVARFVHLGGSCRAEEGKIKVTGASSLTVIIAVFSATNREKAWTRLASELNTVKESYDKMLKAHFPLHNKLYSTLTMELAEDDNRAVEDLMLEASSGTISALLAEKMYKFGRYLLVSATAEEGNILTPSGLWNGSYMAYRSSKCNAGAVEMSYKHSLHGNMSVFLDKTFEFYEQCTGDFENNAMRLYGCRGLFVPAVTSCDTGRLGAVDPFAVHFTGCGGWLCNMYYAYAKQAGDNKFIKTRLLPFMKGVAEFYQDFLVESSDGTMSSCPSALPMRVGDYKTVSDRPIVAKNSALDFAIARHFFANLIEACELQGVYKKEVEQWKQLYAKLPQQQLASDGTYKEFINSTISVDYTEVSLGTLYPAYYSNEVDFLSDDDTQTAYLKTADVKLSAADKSNSFNMAVLAAVYARLGNVAKTLQCLSNVVNGCAMSNLVLVDKDWRGMGVCGSSIWAPVQLQSNMAFANAVQEMILYSHNNVAYILPALPLEWNINVEGLLCDNGVSTNITVNNYKGTLTVELYSKKATTMDIYFPFAAKKLLKSNVRQEAEPFGAMKYYKNLQMDAGKTYSFVWKYSAK